MNIADEISRSVSIRRAFIWDRIIQLGFSPRNDTDKNSWISQFKKKLPSFWGIENLPVHGNFSATKINLTYPGIAYDDEMSFDCSIEDEYRFSVTVMFGTNVGWMHEYDSSFYSPSPDIFLPFILRQIKTNTFNTSVEMPDIEAVIDGLILHPCAHQHIFHPVDNHEIRFGGGITNPYLYLFHLRYQLCPIEKRRIDERERLIDLFSDAIREGWIVINANELMKIPPD
jgi:hypothetical protein